MIQSDILLRVELSEFLDRYTGAIDNNRLEEWPKFFAEGCHYEIISKENVDSGHPIPSLLCKGTAMLRDRVVSLRKANIYEMPVYRHFLSSLSHRSLDTDLVELTANFLVLNTTPAGDSSIFLTGRYIDHLFRSGDDWKIRSKRVIYDTLKVPTLLSFPI